MSKDGKPGAFFIDGPGGNGKTFLYSALYGNARKLGKIVLTTAPLGIAATELPNGWTAHSCFKLPIDHCISCDVPKQGSLAALLKETSLIIWDEAPMNNKASIHPLDLLLRDLCKLELLFGGKIVILGGDFRQALPVVPRKTQLEAIEASLVSSPLWSQFMRFNLTENMRAKEGPAFSNFLLQLRNGELQHQEQENIRLPDMITVSSVDVTNTSDTLLRSFMPYDNHQLQDPAIFTSRTILTPKNDEVDALNRTFINTFKGDIVTYTSYDSVLDQTESIYPPEFLNTLCPSGMRPHELTLKKGCPVILLRNTDPSSGLCNGTRMTCQKFFPNMIVCQIATGFHAGKEVFIPQFKLRPSASSAFPFQFKRNQFPIKLSFAMTINKSQGRTLNEVAIYLKQQCFFACSVLRCIVTCSEGLKSRGYYSNYNAK